MKYQNQQSAGAFAVGAVRDAFMATLVAGVLVCATAKMADPNTWQRMRGEITSKFGFN